jgi:hypothetical protein
MHPARRLALSFAVLAVAGPATATAAQPEAPRAETAGPPEAMIDFLGRRRECAELAAAPGEPVTVPEDRLEWLRCDALAAEEIALRRQFAADASALVYLDQAPEDFELESTQIHSYHGPPRANVSRIELSGTDQTGRVRWQLAADSQADGGRATSISVSWGTHRARTIRLDNGRVPRLDVASVWVAVGSGPGSDELNLEMRFDFPRDWCGDIDRDDRPRLSIIFTAEAARAFRQDRTNCGGSYQELRAEGSDPPVFR